jgi:hypothetical protein
MGPVSLEILQRRDNLFADNHGESFDPDRAGIRSRIDDRDSDYPVERGAKLESAAMEECVTSETARAVRDSVNRQWRS